jgi:hypothetical protein
VHSYQPTSGDRLGVMAGSSGRGLWFITLSNVAGACMRPFPEATMRACIYMCASSPLPHLTYAPLPYTVVAAHGGFFDNIVLTLTDANNVAYAYPLPLSTEIMALPSAGSLFGALPSGAQGPAAASQYAVFAGTR